MTTKKQIDEVLKVGDLYEKQQALFKLFKIKNLDYHWSKQDDFSIDFGNEEIYRETTQHVEAVSKLIRIPQELWLLWATQVLILSDNYPRKISLNKRLKVFRKAFEISIRPYLFTGKLTAEFELEGCVSCGSKNFSEPLSRFVNGKEFFVILCKECNLGARHPRPKQDQLSKIYSEEYFAGDTTERGYFDYENEAPWRIDKAVRYLEKLEQVCNIKPGKTRVLDLGSGYGYFLKALIDKGYDSLGLELAPEAVKFANEHYDAQTLEGELADLLERKAIEGKFDLITLWDVIEHFYDINDDISLMVKILNKKGYVALRTNNLDSIEFDVFGKYFHSIKYEHTFYYSQESLKRFFEKYGMKEVKTWTHTHLFLAFMTQEEINQVNQSNRGGDIFFVAQKN